MGKFARFLKRVKKLAWYGSNVLSSINDIYKGVKPFVDPLIRLVPYGNYINKRLDVSRKFIDKVNPLTSNWLNDEDKDKLNDIDKNIKRYGGTMTQNLLNKYLDYQDNRLGDFENSIFGKPLNWKKKKNVYD